MVPKTVMDTSMVNINQETWINKVEYPYVVPVEDLKHVHPYIKSLFCARKTSNVLLAGRLKNLIAREQENYDKQHKNYVVSGGLYNTISQNCSTEVRKKTF